MLFHFGLTYVWGSDEDILGIRLLRRGDPAIRFEFAFGKGRARAALDHFLSRTESLSRRSEHYHSLLKNCTTELLSPFSEELPMLWKLSPDTIFSYRFHRLLSPKIPLLRETPVDPSAFARRVGESGDFAAALDGYRAK